MEANVFFWIPAVNLEGTSTLLAHSVNTFWAQDNANGQRRPKRTPSDWVIFEICVFDKFISAKDWF